MFIIDNGDSKTFVSMYYSKKDKLNKKERSLNMCLVKTKKNGTKQWNRKRMKEVNTLSRKLKISLWLSIQFHAIVSIKKANNLIDLRNFA